jgi:hypothetical protein
MATLPSGLCDIVSDDEDLARFLTSSRYFNSTMVKPVAFLPSGDRPETSVSRHGSAPLEFLIGLGQAAAGDRNLHGAAIFRANTPRAAGLEVVADEPPPRHALIVRWPVSPNDPDLERAKQKEMAAVIASKATLLVF